MAQVSDSIIAADRNRHPRSRAGRQNMEELWKTFSIPLPQRFEAKLELRPGPHWAEHSCFH